jgi:7-carboxy-7-deazaguanine synthase
MKINSIFSSLQGEGRFQGVPTLFIRMYGCNLRCSYCDALPAVEGDSFSEMTVKEVLRKINEYDFNDVCITGGEPMCQKNELYDLLRVIGKERRISLETNGSFDVTELSELFPEVYLSIDWKTPGSGGESFDFANIDVAKMGKGWIKLVVSSKKDLKFIDEKLPVLENAEIYLSPVYEKGSELFKDVEQFVMKKKNIRFQIQLHKVLGID